MNKSLAIAGALICLLAVALGAYVSHNATVTAVQQASLETAVRYQMWHGLALLVLAVLPLKAEWQKALGIAFIVAIGLFSGSIYARILLHWQALWWLTPVGGSLLILSWAGVILGCWKGQKQ